MSRGFHLWHSQPLDRVTPLWLANPRPPAMSPPRQAEGASELNAKLREKGLMAGKRLNPNAPNPETPTHAEHEETYKGQTKPKCQTYSANAP